MAQEIKPYTLQELANLYGVHPDTFKKWLDRMPTPPTRVGNYYLPGEVVKIFEHINGPSK